MPHGHADGGADRADQGAEAGGRGGGPLRQGLERQHDQRVTGQHGQRLAEQAVDGGLAAARVGVVEAGQVVVDERGAVQQLDRRRRGFGDGRHVLATRGGHGEAQAGADAGATGEHGMPHRAHQPRGAAGMVPPRERRR